MKMLSRYTVLLVLTSIVVGCSNTDKSVSDLAPLVEKLQFPYLKNDTLYEFFPETGESQAVEALITPAGETTISELIQTSGSFSTTVHSPEGNIVYLDIDKSEEIKDNDTGTSQLSHSFLPELVAYSQGTTLFLFEMDTRHTHPIANFKNTDSSIVAICELRPEITLDEESRLIGQILYKNKAQIHVKTSSINCEDGPFAYYRVDLETDSNIEFSLRRQTLKRHSHISTHYHEHESSHDHSHAYEAGEIDENGTPFDPNNHAHNHFHDHGLYYGDLEEHQYLSKAEIDAVHSLEANLDTIYETHIIWAGLVRKSSEAVMYAGHPIFSESSSEIGYLGFNPTKNQYELYQTIQDNLFNTLQLTYSLEGIGEVVTSTPLDRKDPDTPWFTYLDESILFRHGSSIIKLPLLAVFDDDQVKERIARFSNPIYTFESNEETEMIYTPSSDSLLIRDGLKLLMVENISEYETTTENLYAFSSDTTKDIKVYATSDSKIVRKFFAEDNTQSNNDLSAFVKLEGENPTLEQTLFPVSENYLHLKYGGSDNILLQGEVSEVGKTEAQGYDSSFNRSHFPAYENAVWGPINNLFDNQGVAIKNAIVSSVDTINLDVNGSTLPVLVNPNVYQYDAQHTLGQGKLFGTIPGNVSDVVSIDIKSDFYGEVKIKDSYEADAPIKTYFFPTNKSFLNPTGAFGDMKLMYDSSEDELTQESTE